MRSLILSGVLFLVSAVAALAACDETRATLRWDGGTASFSVEIADDFQERAQGLMFREHMARSAGMLFVYERPQPVSFWMRNTLIPLDILFFDETGVLVKAHENAEPLNETSINGGGAIQYVLEINAGLVERMNIGADAQLQHLSLSQQKAAWPCAAE